MAEKKLKKLLDVIQRFVKRWVSPRIFDQFIDAVVTASLEEHLSNNEKLDMAREIVKKKLKLFKTNLPGYLINLLLELAVTQLSESNEPPEPGMSNPDAGRLKEGIEK